MNSGLKNYGSSPLGMAVKVILVILLGEFSIMAALDGIYIPVFGKNTPPLFWELMDPLLLSMIAAPAIHLLVFRPMKQQQAELEKQKEELGIAAVTFNTQDGVVVTDAHHAILRVNQSFTAITGYSAEEVIGRTPAILQSGRHDGEFYVRMRESLDQNGHWEGEIWNRRKNGEIYPEWLTITAVAAAGGNRHYVGIFSDISRRKSYEERINFLAYHDRLTELPSREMFYDCLSRGMSQARRKQDRLVLFYLDLDGFKAINDSHGHEAGDEVLKLTARRLLGCIRSGDTAARLGGDEFAIILCGIGEPESAERVAGKIIRELSRPLPLRNGTECTIGVSIGIAICPENGVEIDRLMSAADNAMYESKAAGKNRYTFSSVQALDAESDTWLALDKAHLSGVPEMDEDHAELARLLNKLNSAVRNGAFSGITDGLLERLASRIDTHFRQEERLMDEYRYPDGDSHRKEHQQLLSELGYMKDKFNRGGEMLVLYSLKEWLLGHIAGSDRTLGGFIAQQRARQEQGGV